MNILNFIFDLTNSNALYYILIVLLVIISLVMVYLMYSQNKELSRHLMEKNKEVKKEEKEEVTRFSEEESLDGREELLEVSRMTIPKHLEYTQTLFSNTELEELQNISKELEDDYKNKKNDIETYEEEQEESAIISYDELLSKTQTIPKIEEKRERVVSDTYSHEENFLNRLKDLNNNLK